MVDSGYVEVRVQVPAGDLCRRGSVKCPFEYYVGANHFCRAFFSELEVDAVKNCAKKCEQCVNDTVRGEL